MPPLSEAQLQMLQSRTGARRRSEVPKSVVQALNEGQTETKNLVEWMVVNRLDLFKAVLKAHDHPQVIPVLQDAFDQQQKKPSPLQQSVLVGKVLAEQGVSPKSDLWTAMTTHPSDVVRECCCTLLGALPNLSLKQRLKAVKPFAADVHFGVRELAWIAVRPHFVEQLEQTIAELTPWATHPHEGVRRFASEATRPCGVWTLHLKQMKQTPEMALSLLEPLRADNSRYVQDSVGNWLNDASKSRPDWVIEVTDRWRIESETPQTVYIIKRALRTLKKTVK